MILSFPDFPLPQGLPKPIERRRPTRPQRTSGEMARAIPKPFTQLTDTPPEPLRLLPHPEPDSPCRCLTCRMYLSG